MLCFVFSVLKPAHLKGWHLPNPHCPNKKSVLSRQECIYIGSELVAWMPLLGTILASCRIKQANRNVNTLLYLSSLYWSGNRQSSLGFGFIWLCMNWNPSKAHYWPFSEIICFHYFVVVVVLLLQV